MKRLNNSGFSLVELMVVVAIIGILAAVAIPNYTKFQRRARAAEGKTLLSGLYDAEKSAYASYEGYSSDFALAGFAPSGMTMRSDVGFAAGAEVSGTDVPASTGANQPNAMALSNAQSMCGGKGNCYVADKFCASYKDAGGNLVCGLATGPSAPTVPVPNAGNVVNTTVGGETFLAASVTNCGAQTQDNWTINQNKQIIQKADCTTGN